ncbi:MAG: hypothetical protein AAF663_08250, partial [Planctomycetota bacterium]
ANGYDGGQFDRGYVGAEAGNHSFAVVTFERTGNFSVQRFTGVTVDVGDGRGAGFGDLDSDGDIDNFDVAGTPFSLESVLNTRDRIFDPAGDVDGDGRVDTRDLLALGAVFEGGDAEAGAADAYLSLLQRRGDQNDDGVLDASDIDALYANLGTSDEDVLWQGDLDVDGEVGLSDIALLVQDFARTFMGDANLDGFVAQSDLNQVLNNWGSSSVGWANGDFNGNGQIEQGDLNAVLNNWGSAAAPSFALNPQLVPEPTLAALAAAGLGLLARRRR